MIRQQRVIVKHKRRTTQHEAATEATSRIMQKLREGRRAGMPASVLADAVNRMIEYHQRAAHRCVYCARWIDAGQHRAQFFYQTTPPAFVMAIACPTCHTTIEQGNITPAMQQNAAAYAGAIL